MANSIKPGDLGAAIEQELTIYHEDIVKKLDEIGSASIKKLVKRTQVTAPMGDRVGGNYVTSIASKKIKGIGGSKFVWYVKPPNHRLTHLLTQGHATKDGGRTKANPFLKNAVDAILPEYEKNVEEALKK